MDIERIKEAIKKFWTDRNADNSRYLSWEHCYKAFYDARGKDLSDDDIDILCLHLAFYLASWGMYRGSSFLLKRDYKIHKEIVKEIMKPEYKPLLGIQCEGYADEANVKLLFKLVEFMRNSYTEIRERVNNNRTKSEISNILITKVLLGTLGCVPAYDRYFKIGIKNITKIQKGNSEFSRESIKQLSAFYQCHKTDLEDIRKDKYVCGTNLIYPQMKILDMGFWQIGYKDGTPLNNS